MDSWDWDPSHNRGKREMGSVRSHFYPARQFVQYLPWTTTTRDGVKQGRVLAGRRRLEVWAKRRLTVGSMAAACGLMVCGCVRVRYGMRFPLKKCLFCMVGLL